MLQLLELFFSIFFFTCLPYEVPCCIFTNFFSDVSQRHVRKPTYNLKKKKKKCIYKHVWDHCHRHRLTVPEPGAQQCACLFLHRPLVAGERSYQKNAVSISSKLFPLSSLSQYWARLFVLFSITTVMHQSSLGSRVAFSAATLSWSGPPRVLCHKKSVIWRFNSRFGYCCCFGWVHFTF